MQKAHKYCMSKSSCPFLCTEYNMKIGLDYLDVKYIFCYFLYTNVAFKGVHCIRFDSIFLYIFVYVLFGYIVDLNRGQNSGTPCTSSFNNWRPFTSPPHHNYYPILWLSFLFFLQNISLNVVSATKRFFY